MNSIKCRRLNHRTVINLVCTHPVVPCQTAAPSFLRTTALAPKVPLPCLREARGSVTHTSSPSTWCHTFTGHPIALASLVRAERTVAHTAARTVVQQILRRRTVMSATPSSRVPKSSPTSTPTPVNAALATPVAAQLGVVLNASRTSRRPTRASRLLV